MAVYKFLEKKNYYGLTRVLYGHGVNFNLTERTKLNPLNNWDTKLNQPTIREPNQ